MEFREALLAFKGIGAATADRIMQDYPTPDDLLEACSAGEVDQYDALINETLVDQFPAVHAEHFAGETTEGESTDEPPAGDTQDEGDAGNPEDGDESNPPEEEGSEPKDDEENKPTPTVVTPKVADITDQKNKARPTIRLRNLLSQKVEVHVGQGVYETFDPHETKAVPAMAALSEHVKEHCQNMILMRV